MTVSSTISRREDAGDGVSTDFYTKPSGLGFYFNAEEDIKVYLRDDTTLVSVLQVLTTDYTVTGEGDQVNGGTVTMLTPPASGETLVIFHDPENKQEVDLIVAGKFQAESLETGLDHAVHLAQRNRDLVDRAITLADGDPTTGGSYDVGANLLSNVTDPVSDQDAVTKAWAELTNPAMFSSVSVVDKTDSDASFTLALTDSATEFIVDRSSSFNITIPPFSSVEFAIGTTITFFCKGSSSFDILRGSGVELRGYTGAAAPLDANHRLGVGGICTIKNVAEDEWVTFGNAGLDDF